MSAFFGMAGQLFEVKCPATADRAVDRPTQFIRLLNGEVRAYVGVASRRSWSLSVAAGGPLDRSTVEAVARTTGPLSWYGPEATVGNLLSPQASAFEPTPVNAVDSGLVRLPDGAVARSVTAAGTVIVGNANGASEWVPVTPGAPVTVGAWSTGGQWFRGFWRDAAGVAITNWNAPQVTHDGWKWHSATVTPPASAAYMDLHLAGGYQYALPSIAWGTVAAPELGTGCPKCVVLDVGVSPIAAHRRLNIGAIDYVVQEVG